MKRYVLPLILLVLLCGCSLKNTPSLRLKAESVSSVEIKKTYRDGTSSYSVSKTVTDREDTEKLISWLESLRLTKHDAIEIPVDQVRYVVVLEGVKTHKLIFIDGFVIYDSTAYTYDDLSQQSEIDKKYNLLNYPEQSTELDLFK